MGRKRYRPNLRFYIIITILIIGVFTGIKLFLNDNDPKESNTDKTPKKEESVKEDVTIVGDLKNIAVIGDDNIYYVYTKDFVLKLPFNLKLNKKTTLQDVIDKKNYLEAMNLINDILPERIKRYIKKDVKLPSVYDIYELPKLEIDNDIYIDSYMTAELFSKYFYNIKQGKVTNKALDILNANRIGGYAGRTGRRLEEKLGYKYNAANYKKTTDYSYIINKDLSRKELENIAMELSEKNIKIRSETDITTLSDAVLILGKDKGNLTYIMFKKYNTLDYDNFGILDRAGYQNLHRISIDTKVGENRIEYNSEDYFTAFKVSRKLNITKLVENNELEDRIDIYLK